MPTLIERFEWHVGKPLDIAAMQHAATRLLGTHDFASFRSTACQAKTTVRTVNTVDIVALAAPFGPVDASRPPRDGDDVVAIRVYGLAFLHNMVRIMGLGRRAPASIDGLLAARDRTKAGRTAPAGGLTLDEVVWP